MKFKLTRAAAVCGLATVLSLTLTGCSPGDGLASGDLERVGSAIARGEATVSVPALSQRLVEDQGDLRLVDLRPVIEFEDGHIPAARSVSVNEIIRAERARELAGQRQLVLYSGDGVTAAQAAALLQLQGVNAVSLQGGYAAWFAYTSDPSHDLPGQEPILDSAQREALAQHFHGATATAPTGRDRAAALGLTPATPAAPAAAPQVDDPHGLGLQYGLGVGIDFELAAVEEEPAEEEPAPRRRLLIGEGC